MGPRVISAFQLGYHVNCYELAKVRHKHKDVKKYYSMHHKSGLYNKISEQLPYYTRSNCFNCRRIKKEKTAYLHGKEELKRIQCFGSELKEVTTEYRLQSVKLFLTKVYCTKVD